ncbi:MAG TPA: SDR family oxidoreductase [Longimicrobium sp.]|nr:SDR family oxidoreductase [Longimicrobium sp.]
MQTSDRYEAVRAELRRHPRTWLLTGAAGFIGSNLLQALLELSQTVVGLDNFATGKRANLEEALAGAGGDAAARFRLVEADVCDAEACRDACAGADVVLHQAALGSVPRSIENPMATHRANVDGFVTVLLAARDAGVRRFVYASSSSVYGDHPGLPKVEDRIGRPLSPYALSKRADELYAEVFGRTYGIEAVGLRYFNVFGRRQDPEGAYAAVIPRWIRQLLSGEPCQIHGDGETSRDFCYVADVLQANLLAATAEGGAAAGEVFNVACGARTTLNELFGLLRERVAPFVPGAAGAEPLRGPFRAGDVRHSLADISRARERLGYVPRHTVAGGLDEAIEWYVRQLAPQPA